ncbi:MAG: ABC transporter permease [Lachnospiraceae bacterium]|nr:ABC transporter permease [Lachnospiraceae bacterium]
MWKDYSSGYIKNNRSSGLSVMIAAFISALLLSLLCGLFYNAWKYEVERIELEEGGWQSRIIGELAEKDIEAIKNFANVKDVVVNKKGYEGVETTIDIYFNDMKSVFSDTPHIAEQVGIQLEKIVYNYELLAMYLIRDSSDTAPRLLFPMFILITLAASFSLIIIIHNSFAVSMNARIHQFGIFSSIGATPKQIQICLLQEAAVLCTVPILVGNLLGIAGSMGLMQLSNIWLGSDIPGRHEAVPGYHPLVLLVTLLITVLTIWISAWLPARKLSRLTPLEAIKNTNELQLKCRKNSYLLARLFGVEGELAGNALKAQRKALRTASLSLIFSFMAFAVMQCFFSLSGISTRETYFERYQEVWDIMVTIKDAQVEVFEETEVVQELTGLESAIVYQKAAAKRIIAEEEMSEDMKSFGGFSQASGNYVTQVEGGWLVNAPIVILDDNSFSAYCEKIGITPRLDGAVILNQIRDVTNPDFRHPDFMTYLKGENATSVLIQSGNEEMTAEIPVLSYTEEVPVLREEYATLDYYELVHFVPASLWKEIKGQIGGTEEDSYICIRGEENVTLEELIMLQDVIDQIVSEKYNIECENRIQEYETNNKQIQGIKAVFGGFCVLLAIIGIGNVFSNTLGFVRQRKREFARYMSVGLTPEDIRKMFRIEAMVLAGRPILITLPLVFVAVGYMLKLSYVGIGEFMTEMPLIPIILFMLVIFSSVVLAYYLAWRNVRKISLAEVIRDDTMM